MLGGVAIFGEPLGLPAAHAHAFQSPTGIGQHWPECQLCELLPFTPRFQGPEDVRQGQIVSGSKLCAAAVPWQLL